MNLRTMEEGQAYRLTSNTKQIVVQPNQMITAIAPSWYGKMLPSTPLFNYVIEEREKRTPFTCPSNENIFITHYSGKTPFSGPIEKLTIIMIGNEEVPNVGMHASSVKTVEFKGHISFTGPVFHVLRQLPLVTSVKFFIGRNQLPIFRELVYPEFNHPYYTKSTPACPNIQSFEIIVDLQSYSEKPPSCSSAICGNHCLHGQKMVFDFLAISLLHRAQESFKNLKYFYTNLPLLNIYNGGSMPLPSEASEYLITSSTEELIPENLEPCLDSDCDGCPIHCFSGKSFSTDSPSPTPPEDDSQSVDTSCSSLSKPSPTFQWLSLLSIAIGVGFGCLLRSNYSPRR